MRYIKLLTIIIILFNIIIGVACAKDVTIEHSKVICSLKSGSRLLAERPKKGSPESKQIVKWISDIAGIESNFDILKAKFKKKVGAFAVIEGNTRYIVYDQEVYSLKNKHVTWDDISVIAHEIGHHVAGHTSTPSGNRHQQELEADKFSGYAMAMIGATLEQALNQPRQLPVKGSKTHPGRKRRIQAYKKGWLQAKAILSNRGYSCTSAWIGDELLINGKRCRLAQRCAPSPSIGLSCHVIDDIWIWKN